MAAKTETRRCPYCKEEIKADAIRCKHCRSTVTPEHPSHGGTCPFCKEEVHPDALKCKHCGSDIGPSSGCEGCDDSADAVLMAAALGGFGGGLEGWKPNIDPECAARLVRCRLECVQKHKGDPLMAQACRDSCQASYRLCRSLSSGGFSIY
jgi:hypothetical protein